MMTDIPMNIKIGQYFSLAEMCASDTAKAKGIDNRPSVEAAVNLTLLCTKVLDPLRKAMGPITISSGFRCAALNKAVGGVSNSQHMKGQAADINIKGDLAYGRRLFAWIKANVEFDQLIWEYNSAGVCWIHVSYNLDGNRKKTFELKKTR
jgi:hypothetical protein